MQSPDAAHVRDNYITNEPPPPPRLPYAFPRSQYSRSRLVDMLESEEDSQRSSRANRSGHTGETRNLVLHRDRRGLFDYDDEPPLQHLHLSPRVSEELEDVYAAVQDEGWEPWPEEKDTSDVRFFFFVLGLGVHASFFYPPTWYQRDVICFTQPSQAHLLFAVFSAAYFFLATSYDA